LKSKRVLLKSAIGTSAFRNSLATEGALMKRVLILFALFVLAIAASALALGQASSSAAGKMSKAEREVRQVLDEWLAALKRGDVAALERIIADDYLVTVSDGRVLNREQDLATIREGVKFESAIAQDVRVRVFKETAIVTGEGIFKVRVKDKDFDIRERFTDIYVKRRGHWQPVASHSTSLKKT
jgi:hypothetical protein